MTIIKGGIIAVRTVNSYSKIPTIPKVHITPMQTVIIDINVALKDLKNRKKINEVTIIASIINFPSSALIVSEYLVRTYGIPEILTSRLYFCSNSETLGSKTLFTNCSLKTVFTTSVFKFIAVLTAFVSELIKNLS